MYARVILGECQRGDGKTRSRLPMKWGAGTTLPYSQEVRLGQTIGGKGPKKLLPNWGQLGLLRGFNDIYAINQCNGTNHVIFRKFKKKITPILGKNFNFSVNIEGRKSISPPEPNWGSDRPLPLRPLPLKRTSTPQRGLTHLCCSSGIRLCS